MMEVRSSEDEWRAICETVASFWPNFIIAVEMAGIWEYQADAMLAAREEPGDDS